MGQNAPELPMDVVAPEFNCCKIMIAFGLIGSAPGPAGTRLYLRLKPQLSQSCVTPIQCPAVPAGIAGFAYSMRIHAPCPPFGIPEVVTSPSNGHVVQLE